MQTAITYMMCVFVRVFVCVYVCVFVCVYVCVCVRVSVSVSGWTHIHSHKSDKSLKHLVHLW